MRLTNVSNDDTEILALIRDLYAADTHGVLTEVKDTSTPALNTAFIVIRDFYETHGRLPSGADDAPIHEIVLSSKLSEIFNNDTRRFAVKNLDIHGLLEQVQEPVSEGNDDEILLEYAEAMDGFDTIDDVINSPLFSGIFGNDGQENGLFDTSFVDAHKRKSAEDIGSRTECAGFDVEFKHLFDSMKVKLSMNLIHKIRIAEDGIRQNEVKSGAWFIINDQMMYIANVSEEEHRREHGRIERRVRVIIDNGQESNILMRSVTKMAHADPKAVKFARG